jgi:hypothetical protein
MSSFRLLLLSLPLLAMAGTVAAATPNATPDNAMSDCVDLGANHEAFRYSNQALLIADGDAHYKLSFGSGCDALTLTSNVDITSDGRADRICPQGTRIFAGPRSCSVQNVRTITAEDYAKYQRKARAR